jgi:mannosyltransferase OCH1-like enzyme
MAIPRILHVTSARVPLAGIEKAFFSRNARVLGAGWTYRIWSDAENDTVMAREFPDLVDTYRALPHGVMRADLSRLAYMHVDGGWYADTDYEWLRDPTEAAAAYDLVLPLARDAGDPGGERLGNAVFGSVAQHPFWGTALRDALSKPPPAELPTTAIEDATGPGLLTRHRESARADPHSWLPPRVYFHTPVQLSHASDATLGTHHTRGSWRTNAMLWRAKMAQRQVERTVAGWRRR